MPVNGDVFFKNLVTIQVNIILPYMKYVYAHVHAYEVDPQHTQNTFFRN